MKKNTNFFNYFLTVIFVFSFIWLVLGDFGLITTPNLIKENFVSCVIIYALLIFFLNVKHGEYLYAYRYWILFTIVGIMFFLYGIRLGLR